MKIMMKYFLTIFFALILLSGWAQAHDPEMQKNAVVLNSRMTPTSLVRTRAKPKENRRGSPFLFEETKEGVVKIKNQPGKEYLFRQMRYDAFEQDIEVILEEKVRYIRGIDLTAFSLIDKGKKLYFINADSYTFKGVKLHGFVQLIEVGNLQVLKRVKIEILSSNYNIALSVGHNYDKLIRKTEYFFARKGVLYQIKNRKDIYRFFSKMNFDAKVFMKQNRIKFRRKKENALQQLARAYNIRSVNK